MKRHLHYRTQLIDDPSRIGCDAWNALHASDADATPFLRYEFLHALHASGCASPRTGWTPSFLTLSDEQGLAAAVPLYRKDHSFGEYVFDWAWAEAHEERGLAYYPKWLAAVPFTPAPGSRLLAREAAARAELVNCLLELVRGSNLSSLHVLLAPPAQIETLAAAGLLVQPGVQFHWRNAGYRDFEQFLAALSQDKRKKIRAERRKVQEAGVELERRIGAAIGEDDWRFFHRCYRLTYAQHQSTPYLSLAFFLELARTMPENLMLVLAHRNGTPVASAFGVFDPRAGASTLYGRYWGATEFVSCLHFECCYYQMIEFAIEQGLQVFEGGAQGAHKVARGLDPVPTLSAHWIANPALRRAIAAALTRQSHHVTRALDELTERSAFKQAAGSTFPGQTQAEDDPLSPLARE
ncbi:MAG TPA: GNAT family N-acetyltransferase [Burkholderiaceae bacterium]|nr:GNAT family N-acetyltransferase [Burkholderiaceae bacterium]